MSVIPPTYPIHTHPNPGMGITGSSNASGYYTIGPAASSTAVWSNVMDNTLSVNGSITADHMTLGGIDVGKTLQQIQDRLAILVPNPVLLEKYEALKQAYDHYKTLEALVLNEAKNLPK